LRDKGGVCPVVRDVVMYAKSYSGSNDRTFCLCEEVCILESLRCDDYGERCSHCQDHSICDDHN